MMFRRQPVPPQAAPPAQATTIPSPTRGIVQSENDSFMQPGGAIVSDNWMPTMQGVRLRGGSIQWSDLHALDAPAWQNAHAYTIGNRIYDITSKSFWDVAVAHTSMAVPKTFAEQRAANPTYWVNKNATVALTRKPVISAFEYSSGIIHRMFAANDTKLFDVTFPMPTLVASGRTSGNYAASQIANQGGDYLVAVNDKGDAALRFNGTTWANLNVTAPTVWANATSYAINARALDTADNTYWKCLIAHTSAAAGTTFSADRIARPTLWTREFASDGLTWITGPPGTPVETGKNLVYVCKYRNRFFFIELNSMNAWYLPLNAVGGQLLQIPLSGAGLLEVIREVVVRSGLEDAHVRPIVTRGFGWPGIDPWRCDRPTLVVTAYPFPPMLGTDPLRLLIGSVQRKAPRSVGSHVKSLNYLDAIIAKQQAKAGGLDDAVMLDHLGAVAECTSTNLFIVARGVLVTPTTRAALPGITRRTIIELAPELGIPVVERDIWPMELYAAEAVFLTGSGAGVVPVAEVDGRPIGTAEHPHVAALADGYRARTRDERFLVPVKPG